MAKTNDELWLKVGALELKATLSGRRVHKADVTHAAEQASKMYREVLEANGYTVDSLVATSSYGYLSQPGEEPVGIDRTDEILAALGEDDES